MSQKSSLPQVIQSVSRVLPPDTRRENWRYLRESLGGLEDVLVLPQATPRSDPSWFGFCLTLRDDALIDREHMLRWLNDERNIGTRLLFGGNLLRQPYMKGRAHRAVGNLTASDTVMRRTFWTGVYPRLGSQQLDYVAESLKTYLRKKLAAARPLRS